MIVIATGDNAKILAAMLQEKTVPTPARTPHTLRVADVVRTYIPQIGYYLFSSFDMLYVCHSYVRSTKEHKEAK